MSSPSFNRYRELRSTHEGGWAKRPHASDIIPAGVMAIAVPVAVVVVAANVGADYVRDRATKTYTRITSGAEQALAGFGDHQTLAAPSVNATPSFTHRPDTEVVSIHNPGNSVMALRLLAGFAIGGVRR
ncbi:MAG: hypothetical protein ACI9T8_000316 [Candidatus Saccharimonadales bacterium]|jgi:hypothetical protein